MFTGLIEEIGVIKAIKGNEQGTVIDIETIRILDGAKLGDSIAIDGACTTIVSISQNCFTIQASPETMVKTIFGSFQTGRNVNLERPLTPNSRLGGHFVTGHVDGTASILAKYQEGNSWVYRFLLDQPELGVYLIPKGSIAINGISLTVNTVENHGFTVSIIPHTLSHTNIDAYSPASENRHDQVNIECDLLGKYVEKLLSRSFPPLQQNNGLSSRSLEENEAAFGKLGKLYSGLWFNHDESIHGNYESDIMHWPEKPVL